MIDPLAHKVKPVRRRKRSKPLSEEVRSMYRVLTITVGLLLLGTTSAYLYIGSLAPANGYTLKQMQVDYEELQAQQRKLDRKIIDAQSFQNLEGVIPDEMQSSTDADFSYINGNTYAQNSQDY